MDLDSETSSSGRDNISAIASEAERLMEAAGDVIRDDAVGGDSDGASTEDASTTDSPRAGVADAERLGYYVTDALSLRGPNACAAPLRSLNGEGVWTLSSARPSNGVDELLANETTKFWQSDGTLPHLLTVQFYKRQSVAEVALYLDFAADDSYTPQRLSIKSGPGLRHDLREVKAVSLPEVEGRFTGWLRIPLHAPAKRGMQRYLRTDYLQVSVSYMFSNGRDLHIRGAHVLGPELSAQPVMEHRMPEWQTPEMFVGAHVR